MSAFPSYNSAIRRLRSARPRILADIVLTISSGGLAPRRTFTSSMPDESAPALVAVVEDDAPSRSAIGRILQAGGFEPVLFASAEAFKAATLGRAPVCLVLDVQLGGMSGIDLQRDLRRSGSALPIIITTAHRADVIRQRAEQHGCLAFLLKPFNAETLLALLRSLGPTPA